METNFLLYSFILRLEARESEKRAGIILARKHLIIFLGTREIIHEAIRKVPRYFQERMELIAVKCK